jgi:hypothetical protein
LIKTTVDDLPEAFQVAVNLTTADDEIDPLLQDGKLRLTLVLQNDFMEINIGTL